MKTSTHRLILALPLIFTLLAPAFCADSFEGEMKFKVTNEKKKKDPMEFSYFIKGDKARMESIDKKTKKIRPMIIDQARKVMIVSMNDQKQYMEISMDRPEKQARTVTKKEGKKDFEATGKTETILGYPCEQYISRDEDGESEIWATKKLGKFAGFADTSGRGKLSAWQERAAREGFFPLKTIEKTPEGEVKSTLEVTSIDKKTLSASLFEPPAGYAKMEMPGHMGGMMTPQSTMRDHDANRRGKSNENDETNQNSEAIKAMMEKYKQKFSNGK